MTKLTPTEALDEAIKIAGGQVAMAEKIGVTQSAVSLWKTTQIVPVKRVPAIEALTGISRHELRPDFFGKTARAA